MNTGLYKSCAVPLCRSTTLTTPHKLFVSVPNQKERRKLWFRLACLTMAPCRNLYFCEDHFDMRNDMKNFMEYHITGSVSRIQMNAGCLPSKFDCQPHRKRVSDMSRPSTDNIQRKHLIEVCIEDKEQNQDSGQDRTVVQRCDEDSEAPIACSDTLKTSKVMEVIELDCDDVTGNNEIHSAINTKESNVSLMPTCNPEIKKETASEEKTEHKQANLTPGTNSTLDLDKFKRRLIRVIARSLVIEKKPEITFWTELKKVTSCDCQLLWTRMRAVTMKKLKRLIAVDDMAQNITKIARLSVTDWLLIDLVLVHEKVDVIGQDDEDDGKDKEEPKTLEYLFKLVLKHNIERLSGDTLTEAWFNAANDYNKCGRFCSPMLLQRRWYQLKELVWYNFYNFWFSYRGDARNLDSAGRFKPTTLQTEIIKHFNTIVTEQFQTWEELIKQKKVVLLEDFERYELALKKGSNTGQENEPDLVVIEPHVDTIDLRLEPDSDSDNTFDTNEAGKTTDNSKINLSIIKNETIDEISDEDDVSMLEAVDIPCDSLKPSNVTINENINKDDTKDGNVNNTTITTISNSDEEITTISNRDEVISDSGEEIIDNDDEDAVILNDSNDTTTSFETKHAFKEQAEDSKNSEFKKSIILDVDVNKSHEKSGNYVNSAGNSYHHNIASQKITCVSGINIEPVQNHQNKGERVIQDIKDIKIDEVTKVHQDTTDITNVQGLITNLISDIKKETSNLPEKQNMNILYDVTSNLGVYMNGLELEDDGIEYFEEDDDDDVTEIIDNTENYVKKDCTTNKKDPPKIDLKLLLQTVVYTKRLNDMDVFRFIDYRSVKDARIINEAIIESIPLHKKTFTMEDISKSEGTYKSDMSETGVSNDEDCQEGINYKSWYFKKPKISTYNPIQLCKNPDFNTRLKRLTAGFFSSERNRRLLKECKPLTIDIYKSIEMKLVNNSLMIDGFPSQTIKKETIETTPESEVPTLLPTENLTRTENVLHSSKQCIPKVCDISNQNNEVDPQIVGRNRIISLPDINQIRRANERLLIAEVTPIQASSTSSKPPVEILQHTANIQSIKEQDCQNKKNTKILSIENSLPPNNDIINVDIPQPSVAQKGYNILMLEPEKRMELEIETSKECETSGVKVRKRKTISKKPPPPVKPIKNIREFVQKGIPTDRLLALDTIERILGICQNNVDPMKLAEMQIKNKTQKLRNNFLKTTNSCKQNRKNDMETGDVQDISIENNEDIVAKEIPVKIKDNKSTDSTPIVARGSAMKIMNVFANNNNRKKRKKRKNKKIISRTIYCCWAREKTVSLSKPRPWLLSPHMCSLPLCSCCCRDDYVKALRELHPRRRDSPTGFPQILISTAVNNGSSDKEQSCEPSKMIIVEKVSQGTNTDDNPEYALNLLEASKIPFIADANEDLPEQNVCSCQQKYYLSSEISTQTLDKVSQVQQIETKDMLDVDIMSGLNPIITSVQSLSHTQPVVLEEVEKTNDNKAKSPSPAKCKTNVLHSVGPYYLTSPMEQETNVPEPLSQLTVVVPASKAYLLNKKVHKTPNPISLGKNKILLCSKRPKDETEKQINEPIPPQLVMLNNDGQPLLEGVNIMLPPSQSTSNPSLYLDSQQIRSISPTNSILEQENTNNISNPIIASCDLNLNVSNENPNVDSVKATVEIKDVRSDETTEGMATLSNSDTLTQSKFAVDINLKCREKLTESPDLNRTISMDKTILTSKLKTIKNTKSSNKIESIPHKSTHVSTKKTILSDLMEMSGISLEDTTVNSESTELAGNGAGVGINNTTDKEISNISANPDHLNTVNALNITNVDQLGSLSLDLNVVSSLYDLKQACDKNKQFFKLDIESGEIIPINVSIKKHTKPKHKPILSNTVIDLTDDGEKEKDLTSDPRPDEQPEVVRPLKLYKAVHPTLLKACGKSILRNPVISKKESLQKKRFTLTQILDRKRKELTKKVDIQSNKIVMECDEVAKTANTNSDSDDEPLAFKAKRKKNDDDHDNNDINTNDKSQGESRSEVTESLGASASATNTNEPEVSLNSVTPVLEPVVFNDSSDEDCILGV